MKFGDVVTCVASLAVILVLVGSPLEIVLTTALGSGWEYVITGVNFLLTTLIGGYIFGGKIWEEARMESIAKITVLAAALLIFYVISFPSLADWAPSVKETYQTAHPGTTLSTSEWFAVESRTLALVMFIYVVMALVLGFIGLYIGSMLRKPVKSQK